MLEQLKQNKLECDMMTWHLFKHNEQTKQNKGVTEQALTPKERQRKPDSRDQISEEVPETEEPLHLSHSYSKT